MFDSDIFGLMSAISILCPYVLVSSFLVFDVPANKKWIRRFFTWGFSPAAVTLSLYTLRLLA